MAYNPRELLIAFTMSCNLSCEHCTIKADGRTLSPNVSKRFLSECSAAGIRRISFTGGEPFLAVPILKKIITHAVEEGMLFGRIMTNGVWFKDKEDLVSSLNGIHDSGYDGSIAISVDAFHRQSIRKLALFIRTAISVWGRADVVSIVRVKGFRDRQTILKLKRLAGQVGSKLTYAPGKVPVIKSDKVFIKIDSIELSAAGQDKYLKNPWKNDSGWFIDDLCKGPGNTFYIMPNGDVKPCCGYASDLNELTIGNIKSDSPGRIIKNAAKNRFVTTVFRSGLGAIRDRLEKDGYRFPGMTKDHCYFCCYLLKTVPRAILKEALD